MVKSSSSDNDDTPVEPNNNKTIIHNDTVHSIPGNQNSIQNATKYKSKSSYYLYDSDSSAVSDIINRTSLSQSDLSRNLQLSSPASRDSDSSSHGSEPKNLAKSDGYLARHFSSDSNDATSLKSILGPCMKRLQRASVVYYSAEMVDRSRPEIREFASKLVSTRLI